MYLLPPIIRTIHAVLFTDFVFKNRITISHIVIIYIFPSDQTTDVFVFRCVMAVVSGSFSVKGIGDCAAIATS